MASATVSGSSAMTLTIAPNGETVLSSADPWYQFFRSLADLFISGEIDLNRLAEEETRWSVTADGKVREFACPAARQLLGSIALTWMEPSCAHDPYIGCECPPMTDDERRARLLELMGRG